MTLIVALLCLIGPGALSCEASGVAYNVGDVFAGVGQGKIKHFSPDGVLLDTLDTSTGSNEDSGMAFDLDGNLYTTNWTASSMSKFNNTGVLIGGFGTGFNTRPESVLVDAARNLYVGQADDSREVLKFNASGGLLGSFSPAIEKRGTDWIDLAADQCTLVYTSEGQLIKRFDVCTKTQLSDFATLPISGEPGDVAFALRIRPNQEVLVATSQKAFRLSSSGAVIQTYPKPAGETSTLFALNLDPDQTSFWTAGFGSGNVYRIDIATGTVLKSFNAGISVSLGGLTVFGEITAAIPPKLTLAPATDTKRAGETETLTAELMNVVNPAGTTITFTVTGANAQTGTGTADAAGKATFTYTGNAAGTDTVVATATTTLPSANLTSNPATILWNKIPTALTYTGPTLIANGQPVTLSGVLKDDVNLPVVGRTVALTLGTGASAQSCNGITNAAGAASCNINVVAQPLGPGTVEASFAGDAVYLPSSDRKPTLIFALPAKGSFVVGDQSASGAVTFWGAQWAKVNALSGGAAPNSFKGFANTLSSNPPQCGGTWSTRPGNSPPPPDAPLPAFMAVLVASSANQSGPTISGNISSIVIVKTNPGYQPDPGHPGTGTVVAVLCK